MEEAIPKLITLDLQLVILGTGERALEERFKALHAPEVEQVLKVLVPTPTSSAGTPTLAEVRWTRKLPFGSSRSDGAYFVGLKFLC